MTTIGTDSPFDAGVIAGRAALLAGKTAGTAARIAGEAVAKAGGEVEDARAAGEAMVPDADRDTPGYGVRLAQCGSNAVGAWLGE